MTARQRDRIRDDLYRDADHHARSKRGAAIAASVVGATGIGILIALLAAHQVRHRQAGRRHR